MQVIEVPFRPIELEWTGAQESVLISLSGACSSWRTQNHLFKLYLYHRASSAQLLNCVQFSVTPWTVACQALLSKGFPRQEYWSRLPFLPPGDLPDPGIKPAPPGGSVVKNLPANSGDTGDLGSIPEKGRSPRGGNGNPLQYSCLVNPMDRGTWWATVHRVAKSWT